MKHSNREREPFVLARSGLMAAASRRPFQEAEGGLHSFISFPLFLFPPPSYFHSHSLHSTEKGPKIYWVQTSQCNALDEWRGRAR